MSGKLVAMALALAGTMLLAPTVVGSREVSDMWVLKEISPDGPAMFYSVENDVRRELWAVHCRQPLRDCVARADGLVLRLDEFRRPWLIAASGPKSRISIQTKNYSKDVESLFARPLNDALVEMLSQKDVFIVLEEDGSVLLRTRTTAIDQVADFLLWISSNTGRTLRDARLWPANGALNTTAMSPEVLERYEIMQRRLTESQRQLIPETKPQVEFAVRSQGGASFFTPRGQSGY